MCMACALHVHAGEPVAFVATIANPLAFEHRQGPCSGPCRREHRLVVLPQWQGVGIGPRLSNLSASLWVATETKSDKFNGELHAYTCKTKHPTFGAFREASGSGWLPMKDNKPAKHEYNHRYVGPPHAFPALSERLKPITIDGAKAPSIFAGGKRKSVPGADDEAIDKAIKAAKSVASKAASSILSHFSAARAALAE